ncbi:MAG: tetratricopeptide repeat protein, partial [Bacteroidetes bacterium]
AFNNMGAIYQSQHQYDNALASYQQALEVKKKIQDNKGIASTLSNMGGVATEKGEYHTSIQYYKESLQIREKMHDKAGSLHALHNLGQTYRKQGDYAKALLFFFKAVTIAQGLGDEIEIAFNWLTIGEVYWVQQDYKKSLEYLQKSLALYEKHQQEQSVGFVLSSIANVFFSQKKYTEALQYYQKSLFISQKLQDKQGIALLYNNIGEVHYQQKDYAQALSFFEQSLAIRQNIGDKLGISSTLKNIALIHQKQRDYAQSLDYAHQSFKIATEIKAPAEAKMAMEALYETYKLKGDYVKALEYHELFKMTHDSLFNVDKAKALATLEAKATLAEKEKEISDLNHNQAMLRKDSELQRIEAERQRNARLALEKEAETTRLLNLAQQERNAHKQDSLRSLAQKSQLEADKHKAQELKLQAEGKARVAELKARDLQAQKDQETQRMQRYVLYLALAGLVSLGFFAYSIFLSKQKEKRAKEEIAEQKEEISQMNEELSSTLEIVGLERAKSDKLLLNILPDEVAHELKETGETQVRYFEYVTVLFADVKGFSALAKKVTPQELIAELNATFSKMDEISMRFGLERIKTIGDCYMACGGLPNANTTNPIDTVLTALNIQHWMNEEYKRRNGNFWQVRLGMHTGDAVAGVIGKTKFAYDIWGNTVNLASRMESGGEVGKVNVTQETFEAVEKFFVGDYREEIEAKNIGKVRAYFIDRLKPEYSADALGFEPNDAFWEAYKLVKDKKW